MARFRVFYNAHRYSDKSDRARLASRIFKAETADDAEMLMAELRDHQHAYENAGPNDAAYSQRPAWTDPAEVRHPYWIGLIHFGHTADLDAEEGRLDAMLERARANGGCASTFAATQ